MVGVHRNWLDLLVGRVTAAGLETDDGALAPLKRRL